MGKNFAVSLSSHASLVRNPFKLNMYYEFNIHVYHMGKFMY